MQPYSVWRVSRSQMKGATDALSLTVLGVRHHSLHNSLLVSLMNAQLTIGTFMITVYDIIQCHVSMKWKLSFALVHSVEPVELRDLLNVLQDVDDWFHFGIYLKVPVSRLREIKREYQTVTDRKITMLDEWSNQVVPTWAGVVQALVGMGRKALAIRIGTKYGELIIRCHIP